MEIHKDFSNKLLKRREIRGVFSADANPGVDGAIEALAKKLNVGPEKIAVKSLDNNFGAKEFIVEAFLYHSVEDRDRIEPKKKDKKGAAPAAPEGGKK